MHPLRVAVTGGSGNISYSLLFRIASGALFGPKQPIILKVHDMQAKQSDLRGVIMELHDCAFPLLQDTIATDVESTIFEDADYCFMVGSKPRLKGMERADLLKDNGEIFVRQGQVLEKSAKKDTKIVVVGNPANTNCLILQKAAPSLPKENFTAMTRLDHNRGLFQLQQKFRTRDIKQFCVWGNHSSTMYPDITHTLVNNQKIPMDQHQKWYDTEFLKTVQLRGSAIIEARNNSSAASAGNAALEHVRDWVYGSSNQWVSMCVHSDLAPKEYGVPEGLIFSFPVVTEKGKWEIVKGLEIDEFSKEMIKKTTDELISEREIVSSLIK